MADLAAIFPRGRHMHGRVEPGCEDATIVGRVKRASMGAGERDRAIERAKRMPWWRKGLVLDTRDAKFWVWRARG